MSRTLCIHICSTYPWHTILISLFLILCTPFISGWLILIPFGIQLFRLLRYNEHVFMADLALLINFSSIFMIPNFGGAIASLIVSGVIIFGILKRAPVFRGPAAASLFILLIYLPWRCGSAITTCIFISCSLIILYFMIQKCSVQDSLNVSRNYILGLLVASIYGYIFRNHPAIISYISTDSLASLDFQNLYRFRSIFLDSNYYSCALILAISLTIQLFLIKKLSHFQTVLIVFLFVFFGMLTYSRTFFVMFIILIFLVLYLLIRNHKYISASVLIFSVAALAAIIVSRNFTAFDVVLSRIFSSRNLSNLTSGRSILLKKYLDYIIHSPRTFFFGDGLDASLYGELGSHNLYVEIPYYIGYIGLLVMLFYFNCLRKILKQHNHIKYARRLKILSFFPLLMLATVYFSLQGLSSTTLYIQIFIALTASLLPQVLLNTGSSESVPSSSPSAPESVYSK